MLTLQHRPRNPREWQAALGIDNECFISLVEIFGQMYHQIKGTSIEQMILENPQGENFRFKSY